MPDLNGVMMQYFHWYIPADGSFWDQVSAHAEELAAAGITALWLPPAYKGIGGGSDVGYGVYDMYDLGEFDQKGSVRTKYGTKAQYLAAVETLKQAGIQVYADTVLNHRMGADEAEFCMATPFSRDNRLNPSGAPRQISSYTNFTFPGRKGLYSDFHWNWQHFDAVDYDALNPAERDTVYLLEGKRFDDDVSQEFGNYAYLMGCDIDFQDAEVRAEIIRWGKWCLDTTGAAGFRLDAIKHIAAWFFPEWHDALEKHAGKELFMVGEYWANSLPALQWYIDDVGGRMTVFDVPLHFNFYAAGWLGRDYDMRRIFDDTLMKTRPTHAVTFVDNHDSQPLQALESPVKPWFKPLAYALILLRRDGYPCIFYPDYYGAEYDDNGRDGNSYHISMPSHRFLLDKFLYARKHAAFGEQIDYFDHPSTVGWTRLGDNEHPRALAVIMSNGDNGLKWMNVARKCTRFNDITGHIPEAVMTNGDGWGEFRCPGGKVSVWVEDTEEGSATVS
ncbi:MAG TPA: alpha-amylase [Desulfuromonadales bacterium]|nr:alpha-amylase [Desulfuromonadales bacterium]